MLSLPECFEMEPRTSRHRPVKKVVAEEYELRDLPQGAAISCWWLCLPVFYYLAVIAGGVLTSISIGKVIDAFATHCILYSEVKLIGLDLLNNTKVLTSDNVFVKNYGDDNYCLFPEYASVACVMYAGILLVMVLQCGRGGGKSAFRGRGIAESWRIVPVAFVFNLIFLIFSSIIFSYIQNGFSQFCDGMEHDGSSRSIGNFSRCADVLQYTFPADKCGTNLYMQYVLSKTGASLQLGGSLLAFLTIIIRCCLPADFIVYRRRKIATVSGSGMQSSGSEHRSLTPASLMRSDIVTTVSCHAPAEFPNGDDSDSVQSGRSDVHLVSQSSSTSRPKVRSNTRSDSDD